ncbi:MAG: M20/M25/M40 family metallo-hydrolase [Thermoanaerobaculia bacterium]|nr:M20/M25/M40 family metallo-hydrolase [Thermoanaerobaculia bacterium]
MRVDEVKTEVGRFWDDEVIPTISKYVEIPNLSPLFDPNWIQTGHMAKAVDLVRRWVLAQNVANSRLEVLQDGDRTPVLVLEVDGASDDTILLYGRGSSDDGYAIFSVVSAIKALQTQKVPHARLVVLIECCEESGSIDLPYYVDKLSKKLGTPSLVICLDSGCGDYDALWCTTSLRGSIVGNLTVEVLREGVHSGDASGAVPSSFRILRILLDRIEEASTGKIIPEWLWVDVPTDRMVEVRRAAEVLGSHMLDHYPFLPGVQPVTRDIVEMILNRTWRPMLAYTGQEGLPDLLQGGNVLRPKTALKLSLRVPPTLDATNLDTKLKQLLESDPPYGAKVSFEPEKGGAGWNCPKLAPWLETSLNEASRAFYGRDALSFGEGGSIPFMGMLSEKFPEAQFLVTGVLGPHSNAHGPNEFLHIAMGKNLTGCVARVIADHHKRGA